GPTEFTSPSRRSRLQEAATAAERGADRRATMGWWSDAVSAAKERLMTDHRMIRGGRVTVTNTRPDLEPPRVFEKLDGALGVIERYQPHRLRRFRRDVRGIIVKRFACRAAVFGETRGCIIARP